MNLIEQFLIKFPRVYNIKIGDVVKLNNKKVTVIDKATCDMTSNCESVMRHFCCFNKFKVEDSEKNVSHTCGSDLKDLNNMPYLQ